MASTTFSIDSSLPQGDAFARLVDLTRVNEWDRGVTNPRQVSGDGPHLGARYEVTVTGFDGAPTQVVYELTEVDAPSRFVMVGENDVFRAEDTLIITGRDAGSSLSYTGSLTLLGDDPPLTEPHLDAVFAKVAAIAESGLREFLNPKA